MFRRRDTEAGPAGSPGPSDPSTAVGSARGPLLPSYPPHDYLGQLDPGFQAALSERRADADPAEGCRTIAVDRP